MIKAVQCTAVLAAMLVLTILPSRAQTPPPASTGAPPAPSGATTATLTPAVPADATSSNAPIPPNVQTPSATTGATASPTPQEMEPIIVTGSAIPTTDTEGASPVTVIDSETIQQRG